MPNPLNFLSRINPLKAYRDPLEEDAQNMGIFNQGGPFMGQPPQEPSIIPGLRNAFAPPNPGMAPEPEQPMAPARMSALDQYRESMANQPYQEGYNPSKKRMLGGILLGGLAGTASNSPTTGFSMGRSIVRAPYDNAMEQWKTSTTGYKGLADAEQDASNAAANQELRKATLDSLNLDRAEKNRISQERADATTMNAQTNARKASVAEGLLNGGTIFKVNKTGEYWINKKGGGVEKINIQDYNMQEILDMQNKAKLEVVDDEQAFRERAAQQQQKWEESNIRLREQGRRETALATGSGGGGQTTSETTRPLTANEIKNQRDLLTQQFVEENRTKYPGIEDMFEEGPSGELLLVPRGRPAILGGRSPEENKALVDSYNALMKTVPATSTSTTVRTKGSSGTQPQPTGGGSHTTGPRAPDKPANGATHTFPDGRTLKFDGRGWTK
jgi:hypothetical protein